MKKIAFRIFFLQNMFIFLHWNCPAQGTSTVPVVSAQTFVTIGAQCVLDTYSHEAVHTGVQFMSCELTFTLLAFLVLDSSLCHIVFTRLHSASESTIPKI